MSLDEGIRLRHQALAERGHTDARIFALSGCHEGQEDCFIADGVIPVINSLAQLERWRDRALAHAAKLPAALHIDTAMTRLGLDTVEMIGLRDLLQKDSTWLDGIELCCVMSHLSAGEDLADPTNDQQLAAVQDIGAIFPSVPLSLSNSGGTLRGGGFHMALNRPGIALYGLHPAGHEAVEEQIDQQKGSGRRCPGRPEFCSGAVRRPATGSDITGHTGWNGTRRSSPLVSAMPMGYPQPRQCGKGRNCR